MKVGIGLRIPYVWTLIWDYPTYLHPAFSKPNTLSPKPLNPETPKLRKNSAPEVGPLQERPSIGDQILAQPRPLLALLRVYRASGLGPIEV